ncbi:MAG: hypothetical protein ACI90Q_002598 [Nonlabens sp.]|jgi:hypothetical protein
MTNYSSLILIFEKRNLLVTPFLPLKKLLKIFQFPQKSSFLPYQGNSPGNCYPYDLLGKMLALPLGNNLESIFLLHQFLEK